MKFYDFDCFSPNPWTVRMFALEKGPALERHVIDLFSRENRREPFLSTVNPVRCEFAFTRAAGSETARDNGFPTYSSPAPRESVVDFPRGMSA